MTRRDRLMLAAVLAFAVLGAFWMLVLSPQRTEAANAEARLGAARGSLSEAQQKLANGRAAEQDLRVARKTVVKLGRIVPESDDIPTLLTQLSAIAKREKVVLTSYSVNPAVGASADAGAPSAGETGTTPQSGGSGSTDAVAPLYAPGSVVMPGGLGRTPIQLEVKGRYFALERYLRSVQRLAVVSAEVTRAKGRLLIVDGFTYAPVGEAGGDLKAQLSASVYFAPAAQTPPTTTPQSPASATTSGAPASAAPESGSTGAAIAREPR